MNIFESNINKLLTNNSKFIMCNIKQNHNNMESLKKIIELEIKGKNRVTLIKKINTLVNTIKNKGTKSGNGNDETQRLKIIADEINSNSEIGRKMKESYKEKFNKDISKVDIKGSKSDYYDLLIINTDGTKLKCEEKGTKNYSIIDCNTIPYENSVQFYNGPAKNFSISKKYLQIWYNENVNNAQIKQMYNLPNIPSFEEWLEGSPYCMVDPTNNYSKMLKKNYREKYGENTSMNGWKHDNIDYRAIVNSKFNLSEFDKQILIKETQEIYTNIMNEKEIWLQTTGNPCGLFSFSWYDKIEPKIITDVYLVKKKDVLFKFILDNNINDTFTAIMRWGKGCGFSCFRIDFK